MPIHLNVWPFRMGSLRFCNTHMSSKSYSVPIKFCEPGVYYQQHANALAERRLSPSMVVEPSLWTTNTHSVPATILTKSPSSATEHRSIPAPVRKVNSLSLVATTTLPFPCMSPSERIRIDLDGVGPPAATPSTRTFSPSSYVHSPCVAQLP